MKNELLDLHHMPLLRESLSTLGDGLSEYCFANLYLFRHVHHYRVLHDERLFICGKTYDDRSFLMPVFNVREADTDYLLRVIGKHDFFFPISRPMLRHFDNGAFSSRSNVDDSDYIYHAEKMIYFKGRRLAEKRDLMERFLKTFKPSLVPLTNRTRIDAEKILDRWLVDVGKPVQDTDYHICREALCQMDRIGLEGTVYYADGEPAGFVLYSEVFPEMCAIHFAKGRHRFKGLHQYMFSHCARTHSHRFSYLNFEQDLGKLNFRKIKCSYDPARMLRKYRVKPVRT